MASNLTTDNPEVDPTAGRTLRLLGLVSAIVSLGWFGLMLGVKLELYQSCALTGDIAQYCNMLYNTGSGGFLYSDLGFYRLGQGTFLNEHFAPSFALLAPLYHLFKSAVFLLTLQVFSIAFAGFLLGTLATEVFLKERLPAVLIAVLPLVLQLLYLWHPVTVTAVLDKVHGFHHDSLIPPLILGCLFCAWRGKWITALICFVILLGLKENIPILAILCLGTPLFCKVQIPKKAVIWMAVCCAVLFLGSFIFQHMSGNRHVSIVLEFFWWPGIKRALFGLGSWWTLLAFLPALFCPPALIPMLVEFALHLVGGSDPYSWRLLPLMATGAAGTVFGLAYLFRKCRELGRPAISVVFVILFVGLFYAQVVGVGMAGFAGIRQEAETAVSAVSVDYLRALEAQVPADARLAASNDLLIFLVNRPHLLWPDLVEHADYVILSKVRQTVRDRRLREQISARTVDGTVELVESDGILSLYRCAPGQ